MDVFVCYRLLLSTLNVLNSSVNRPIKMIEYSLQQAVQPIVDGKTNSPRITFRALQLSLPKAA